MPNKKVGVPKTSVGTNEGATLNLLVLDRLSAPHLFPKQGSLDEQVYAKSVAKKVVLSQDEATDCALVLREGRMSFNQLKDFSTDIYFTPGEINFLKDQVRRMDEAKLITYDMINLCQVINEATLKGTGKKIVKTHA